MFDAVVLIVVVAVVAAVALVVALIVINGARHFNDLYVAGISKHLPLPWSLPNPLPISLDCCSPAIKTKSALALTDFTLKRLSQWQTLQKSLV